MRRLNNVEYTNTIRDLTGVDLSPAREFPADGAAGEGFSNSGDALAMSPALLAKYLDAAKEVASHAVLLPDGLGFSPGATRRDWTDEILASLRRFHARYAGSDGRLPIEAYLAATIERRRSLAEGRPRTIEAIAAERKLSPKYLQILWDLIGAPPPRGRRPARFPPRPLAQGRPRRREVARRRGPPLAGGHLEIQQRRPLQALAGTRRPGRRVERIPPEGRAQARFK